MTRKSVKILYLIINKINKYVEESNRNKYLALVAAHESKDTIFDKNLKNYGIKPEV